MALVSFVAAVTTAAVLAVTMAHEGGSGDSLTTVTGTTQLCTPSLQPSNGGGGRLLPHSSVNELYLVSCQLTSSASYELVVDHTVTAQLTETPSPQFSTSTITSTQAPPTISFSAPPVVSQSLPTIGSLLHSSLPPTITGSPSSLYMTTPAYSTDVITLTVTTATYPVTTPTLTHSVSSQLLITSSIHDTPPSTGSVTTPTLISSFVPISTLISSLVTTPTLISSFMTTPTLISSTITTPTLISSFMTMPTLLSSFVTTPSSTEGVSSPASSTAIVTNTLPSPLTSSTHSSTPTSPPPLSTPVTHSSASIPTATSPPPLPTPVTSATTQSHSSSIPTATSPPPLPTPVTHSSSTIPAATSPPPLSTQVTHSSASISTATSPLPTPVTHSSASIPAATSPLPTPVTHSSASIPAATSPLPTPVTHSSASIPTATSPLPTPGLDSLVVATLITTPSSYASLLLSWTTLEQALGTAYRSALLLVGQRQTPPTTVAKIMEVLSRDPSSGATPVVYYIVAGNQLVPARVVAVVMGNSQTTDIGGFPVVSIVPRANINGDSMELIAIIAGSAGGGVLMIVGVVSVTFTLVCVVWKRKKRRNRVMRMTEEGAGHDEYGGGAPVADSTHPAALLAPHLYQQQQQQGRRLIPLPRATCNTTSWGLHDHGLQEEAPATLFERVAHFSSSTHHTPSKMRFHSSVAPSPSISQTSKSHSSADQQVKVSSSELEPAAIVFRERGEGDDEVLQRRLATLERLRLRSQQRTGSRRRRKPQTPGRPPPSSLHATAAAAAVDSKQKENELEAALGDVEPSSHSDGSTAPVLSRPSTKRRFARRKLFSRGQLVSRGRQRLGGETTDGYDVTDVSPSRQSRKGRIGRSQRARPLNPQRELAWMQTNSGMQLISIQPVERVVPSSSMRPAWQPLPRLPVDAPAYSRQQLDQLLQLHRELEQVERGGHHITPDSTIHSNSHAGETPLPAAAPEECMPHLITMDTVPDSRHGYPGSSQPVYYNNPQAVPWQQPTLTFSAPAPPSMGQLVWSPHAAQPPLHSRPVEAMQLAQLRAAPAELYYHHHQQQQSRL